jgi:hypothetical protein
MLEWLNGYKTYIGSAVVICGASLKVLGPIIYPGNDYDSWGNYLITLGTGIISVGLGHKIDKNTDAMLKE